MDENEESFNCTPPEIVELATATASTLIPETSKSIYNKTYATFNEWRVRNNAKSFSENVLLAYFAELSAKYKPSSLWSLYSMIKSMLRINHDVDLEKYGKLRAFLKRKSEGFQAKKSSTLTPEQIRKFIDKAPDEIYLLHKVILIIGIMGACRPNELYQMNIQDVKDLQTDLLITIPKSKTKIVRKFTINSTFYNIVKKYIDLRPSHVKINSFFLNYQKYKCTIQRLGKNKFADIGRQIAKYLNLPNPQSYTGHCYRRSSATLYIDGGGDLTGLKRHGGWKSTQVAEGYIDQSMRNKATTAHTIAKEINRYKL
uniref:Uncharacterized protein LOC114348327 n=1 Tax=Diabrotica virgifera virgifera TaxID=50390 RepID=A0A6P7GY87_DIAVI